MSPNTKRKPNRKATNQRISIVQKDFSFLFDANGEYGWRGGVEDASYKTLLGERFSRGDRKEKREPRGFF